MSQNVMPRWTAPAAVVAVVLATLGGFLAIRWLQLADVVVLYMFAITLVANRSGRGPGLLAAALSVACLDFFFIAPRYSFSVEDIRYLGTFGMMLGLAWLVGGMSVRIRDQVQEASERERHTAALFRLGGVLAEGGSAPAIQERVEDYLRRELELPTLVLVPGAGGHLQPRTAGGATLNADELGVAQWALDYRSPSGVGTPNLPGSRGLFLPMGTDRHPEGVLAVFPAPGAPPQRDLLESLAAQVSLALARARLAGERAEARIRAEQERLRSTLLSSVSHDLRTPLGTITGATSTLLDPGPGSTAEDRRMLLLSIQQESMRLEKLVNNLLEVTRLESGQLQVRKEWVPMEEIVGSALSRMDSQLEGRQVSLRLEEAWVPLDPVLLEQVLLNILDNALKFSPPGSPLEITGRAEPGQVVLAITDHGPGFAPGEEERVFEKLYRGRSSAQAPGAGLGLAICRGIVQAHGGAVKAQTLARGGARVTLTLPVEGTPPDLTAEEAP